MQETVALCDRDNLEADYIDEFIRTKRVPQNLFYLVNGATSFYSYRNVDLREIDWGDEYQFFAEQTFWSKDRSLVFISLGCGNAAPEKMLLRQMNADGYSVDYVGVDSSESMIRLGAHNLEGEAFDQLFALGDFGQPGFREELWSLVEDYDVRIYAMIGGTMGNFDQAWIGRMLSDLVAPGDYLYLDVVPIYSQSEKNERLRERLSQLPTNLGRFFDDLLSQLGLSREGGHFVSDESRDEDLNTIRYTFYFEPDEKLVFSCVGHDMALEPGERIELLSIRAYDIASLKSFLREQGFTFVDTYVPDVGGLSHLWQRLLFQRRSCPETT